MNKNINNILLKKFIHIYILFSIIIYCINLIIVNIFMYFIVDDTIYRTTYFTVNDTTFQTFPVISMLIAAIMFCLINININQEFDEDNNIIYYELSIGTLFKAKLRK
nr:MAG TPA: hypothetical protein [Caudoviricetes sp.]